MFNRAILFVIFLLIAGSVRAQVVINEFSSQSSPDWIELYNIATESADLSLYYLEDSTSKLTPDPPLEGNLEPGNRYSFSVQTRLNIDHDTIKLFKEGSAIPIDQISYGDQAELCVPSSDQSIGRKPDGTGSFIRFGTSSRDASNNNSTEAPCPTDTPTKTLTPTKTPSVTKTPTSPPVNTSTHTPLPTSTQTPVQVRQLADQPSATAKPTALRTPTPKKTPTPTPKIGEAESGMYVLGESTGSSVPSATPPTGARSSPSYTPLIITFLLVGIGLGIIAAVLAWQKHQEMKHHE